MGNNPVENSIRPIAVGKKNWLFAGSERAGQRAAAIQSLLATAKLNGLEPLAWLTDTLENYPRGQKVAFDELLPLRSMAKKGESAGRLRFLGRTQPTLLSYCMQNQYEVNRWCFYGK
ncbi:MAG: transposase domain-containing protein [Moraxellaceae bacterium]|nr:transposase domain-containing protein [Moraxellaceae bacterium]